MFDIDFKEEGEVKIHIKKFFLRPSFWSDPSNHLSFPLSWNSCEFNKNNINLVSNSIGVYCFVVKPVVPDFFDTAYLFYVGKTNRTLQQRFKEYLRDQLGEGKPRPKVFKMLKLYEGSLHFYYSDLATVSQVDEAEEKLLNTFIPHVNVDIPKAKIKPELKYIYEN